MCINHQGPMPHEYNNQLGGNLLDWLVNFYVYYPMIKQVNFQLQNSKYRQPVSTHFTLSPQDKVIPSCLKNFFNRLKKENDLAKVFLVKPEPEEILPIK